MHLNEETLVLHYYGELGGADEAEASAHLGACPDCRAEYTRLQRVLAIVDTVPVPDRSPGYEDEVWADLQRRLPGRPGSWRSRIAWTPARWALAGGLASLLVAAFIAGRFWPLSPSPGDVTVATEGELRERILLVAVGDHLEQSQLVLIELVNAGDTETVDISAPRDQAIELVSDNRLYRMTAEGAGDVQIADVLDELERVLIEVARSPAEVPRADLRTIVDGIDAQGLLFKVRVVGRQLREREEAAAAPLGRAVS